jgi:glutathione S-transferase
MLEGSPMMRKLYHSYLSPYARRVLIVLTEKGWSMSVKKICVVTRGASYISRRDM